MGESEARRIFQQIIFGVEYLHTHQVSHRDLKPENILLDEDNNVKLADFGLSNIMKDGIFLYSSCGSPNYAAPELISGKYYNGASIDIWSCGVILFTLLTGTLPFNEKQTAKLYQKIRECKFVMPEFIPDSAKDLIYRMLQKDPLDRISIAEIKQHQWFSNKLQLFQIIDNHRYIYGSRNQINKDVIHTMALSNKINPDNFSEEELSQKITTKERKDLCTMHEFLENEENERQFKEKKAKLKSKYFYII
jgi:5'-AMP-activated protein kinase catalytic alpha subunit